MGGIDRRVARYTQPQIVLRVLSRVLVVVTFGLGLPAQALNLSNQGVLGISRAYGFVYGQDLSLARIERTFPDLAPGVAFARARFEAGFPEALRRLEAQLEQAGDREKVRQVLTETRTNLRDVLAKQPLDRETAARFLEAVGARARGEIESPILEYLLASKYESSPVSEFLDGHRQRYRTDGSGKSRGIQVSMQLPRSWKGRESERPHLVQVWLSEGGTGREMIILAVEEADMPSGTVFSKAEVAEFVRSGEVRGMVPEGATYRTAGQFSLETLNGVWLEYEMLQERAGTEVFQRVRHNAVFLRGRMVALMCSVRGGESAQERERAAKAFERLRPVCQQVLNSIVLPQVYQK